VHHDAGQDLRGSAPVMSARDLLLEVYHDMKFVRPALENLLSAGLVARVEAIERDHVERDGRGGAPVDLVQRVENAEHYIEQAKAAGIERRRIGDLSARTLAFVVMASNFVLGLIVMFVNILSK